MPPENHPPFQDSPLPSPPSMSKLTEEPFTLSALLHLEAVALTKCCPIQGEAKAPNCSKSSLTQEGRRGKGPGHCAVRLWPSDSLPGAWGLRNRAVLLDEVIEPSIWSTLPNTHSHLFSSVTFTRLFNSKRPNDNGNEEEYRGPMAKIFERLTAIAFIFFLNQWLKVDNKNHPDLPHTLATLCTFNVKEEHTYQNFSGDFLRSDVVIQIDSDAPFPISKSLPKSTLANMTMANVKATGNANYPYTTSSFSSNYSTEEVSTVDKCLDCILSFATSHPEKSTIQQLSRFIRNESGRMEWAQIAVGHLSQMASELDVCSSSCGVFSSIWGFHRIGLLVGSPSGNTLFVSENLSAGKDRNDLRSNKAIIEDLFFMIVCSMLLTYGERIVPPNLKDEIFLSWFRRLPTLKEWSGSVSV